MALSGLPRRFERHEKERCLKSSTETPWLFDDAVLREVESDNARHTNVRLSDEAVRRSLQPQKVVIQYEPVKSARGGFQASSFRGRGRGRPSFPTRGKKFASKKSSAKSFSGAPTGQNSGVVVTQAPPQVRVPRASRGKKQPFQQ